LTISDVYFISVVGTKGFSYKKLHGKLGKRDPRKYDTCIAGGAKGTPKEPKRTSMKCNGDNDRFT